MSHPPTRTTPLALGEKTPLEERTDAELIQAVVAGETEKFQPLMERYQQAIFGYLYRMLNLNRETARDLTQSVFLKAFQNLSSVDVNRPFKHWLYRIAHNEAANSLRTRSRKPEIGLSDQDWENLPSGGSPNPEAQRVEAEQREIVDHALHRLKPKYRDALILHYYEDCSYEEIAAIMRIRSGTVGTLIHRGRKQMEELLAARGLGNQPS